MGASETELRQMRAWVEELNAAADAYYNGRGERMTDFEWDALFDRLKALERATGVTLDGSPTARVSADTLSGRKEAHEFAALSLAKTKSPDEVVKWAEGRPLWVSWKLDGLTLVVTYDGGRLTKVVTRGDGHTGTNITHLAAGIAGIPPVIADKGHWVVRGEAVIAYADFEAFVATAAEDYANPRNLAAGSLTLKDVEELKARHLRWIAFTLVAAPRPLRSWGERMDALDALALKTVERELIPVPTAESVRAAIARWTERTLSRQNPYPVDGLVFGYDDTDYAATGSVTGHHATRAGLAFKWQDEEALTVLERVEWNCSVGSITPVAVFRSVALEGTEVRRSTLCNISECERLGIGGAGTEIAVIKANKIIPKVVRVIRRVGELTVPAACPVCGAPTRIDESATGTRVLRCTSAACPARELAKYERFVAKDAMDIDGLAVETLRRFVNQGWIRTFADIYRLGAHRDEIAALEGFGAKSADNLVRAIEAARERGAVGFLVALSVPLCGVDVARRLVGAYGGEFARLLAAVDRGDDFSVIEGIGPQKAAAFTAYFRDGAHRSAVEDLLREVRLQAAKAAKADGRCAGLTFVITGEVGVFANRDAFKAYVLAQGGKVAGSVSGKTDFLVNNDLESTSGKNLKAKELKVPIISEQEFIARFGGPAEA